jgi:hypothetical protein
MCCVETHILPGQEDFYADADAVGSGTGRIFEVRDDLAVGALALILHEAA